MDDQGSWRRSRIPSPGPIAGGCASSAATSFRTCGANSGSKPCARIVGGGGGLKVDMEVGSVHTFFYHGPIPSRRPESEDST